MLNSVTFLQFRFLIVLLLSWGTIPSCFGQSTAKIENALPPEIRDREDVQVIVQKLKFLRASQENFGENHPSWNSIRAQIQEHETALQSMLKLDRQPPAPDASSIRVEDALPKELLDRLDVQIIREKLKFLRINATNYGENHPKRKTVEAAIIENEFALRNLLELNRNSNKPADPAPEPELPRKIKPTNPFRPMPDAEELPPKARVAFGIENRPKWAAPLKIPRLRFERLYQPEVAFDRFRFDYLTGVGAFPAGGLLWGIDNDRDGTRGRLWQWQDLPSTQHRALFWECDGKICSIAFDRNFKINGWIYVSRFVYDQEQRSRFLEVIRVETATTPPFQLRSTQGKLLVRGEVDSSSCGSMVIGPHDAIYIDSGDSQLLSLDDRCSVTSLDEGLTRIEWDAAVPQSSQPLLDTPGDAVGATQLLYDRVNRILWKLRVDGNELVIDSVSDAPSESRKHRINLGRTIELAGAIFYHGQDLDPLSSSIVFIDTSHGEIWSLSCVQGLFGTPRKVGRTSRCLVGLGLDSNDEPLLISDRGVLFRLVSNEDSTKETHLSNSLSGTGFFAEGKPVQGFVPYSINTPANGHGGSAQQRWIGMPDDTVINTTRGERWDYPDGCITIQTISENDTTQNNPSLATEMKKVETRILIHQSNEWYAFTYAWRDDQSDADLVSLGDDSLNAPSQPDSDGLVRRHYPARYECSACHIRRDQTFVLGLTPDQRQRTHDYDLATAPQWETLRHMGLIGTSSAAKTPVGSRPSANPWLVKEGLSHPASKVRDAIDGKWMRSNLIDENLVRWLDASLTENGFLRPNLDNQWKPKKSQFATIVSQGRLLYVFSAAHRLTGEDRYRIAAERGGDFLLKYFGDSLNGGFYWKVSPDGTVSERTKSLYGQAFAIFGLSHAYLATGNDRYRQEAMACWQTCKNKLRDNSGGYFADAQEDFSKPDGHTQNPIMHMFEALLALYDATGSTEILEDVGCIAEFVCNRLLVVEAGFIPEEFDSTWTIPAESNGVVWIEMGHQPKWAFLLSEGVERGLPRSYLTKGNRLLDYAIERGYDRVRGGLGESGDAKKKGAWQQAEFVRALIRYADLHDRDDLLPILAKSLKLIQTDFIDPVDGGWPEYGTGDKGNIWKVGSYEVGMYLEGIRATK